MATQSPALWFARNRVVLLISPLLPSLLPFYYHLISDRTFTSAERDDAMGEAGGRMTKAPRTNWLMESICSNNHEMIAPQLLSI